MSRRNVLNGYISTNSGGVITFYVHLYVPSPRPNYPPAFDIIVDFICEKGMTFREFINSEYNASLTPISTLGDERLCFYIVTLPNKTEIIACKGTNGTALNDISLDANLDDVIIENTTYETKQ